MKKKLKSRDYCYYLLNKRDYGEAELRKKLLQNSYEENDIDSTIEELKESSIVNDERVLEVLIKNIVKYKDKTKEEIFYYCKKRGYDSKLINKFLFRYYTKEREFEIINNLIRKSGKNFKDVIIRDKFIDKLIRKGYQYSEINEAIDRFIENK